MDKDKNAGRRGINNKLTRDQAIKVKFEYKNVKTAKEVADEFGVHIQTIYKIWSGENWYWLEKE